MNLVELVVWRWLWLFLTTLLSIYFSNFSFHQEKHFAVKRLVPLPSAFCEVSSSLIPWGQGGKESPQRWIGASCVSEVPPLHLHSLHTHTQACFSASLPLPFTAWRMLSPQPSSRCEFEERRKAKPGHCQAPARTYQETAMCLHLFAWKGPGHRSSFFSQAAWLRTELPKATCSCVPSVTFATSRDLPCCWEAILGRKSAFRTLPGFLPQFCHLAAVCLFKSRCQCPYL